MPIREPITNMGQPQFQKLESESDICMARWCRAHGVLQLKLSVPRYINTNPPTTTECVVYNHFFPHLLQAMSLPAPRNFNESRLARSVRELSCILCHAYINIDAYVGLLMRGVPLETFKGQLKAVGSWHKPLRRMYTCVVPRAVPKSTSDPPVRHRYRKGCLFLSYSWDSSVYRSIYLGYNVFLFHLFFFTFSAVPCIPDRQRGNQNK